MGTGQGKVTLGLQLSLCGRGEEASVLGLMGGRPAREQQEEVGGAAREEETDGCWCGEAMSGLQSIGGMPAREQRDGRRAREK
jgi:hypothetical protein